MRTRRRATWSAAILGALLGVTALVAPSASAVIGGRAAAPGEAPFMVSIESSSAGSHFCGGSVIAPGWVLTAAHCMVGQDPAQLTAITGRRVLSDTSSGTANAVAAIFVHPQYDAVGAINDVALLQLATPTSAPAVRLSTAVDDHLEAPGAPATVFGWGATLVPVPIIGGILDGADALQAAEVPVVDDEACRSIYAATLTDLIPLVGSPVPSPPDHVCAAAFLKDSCFGDSGGPLVAPVGNGWTQIGVVSTGLLCAVPTHPGIYAEVNSPVVRNWITATTGV